MPSESRLDLDGAGGAGRSGGAAPGDLPGETLDPIHLLLAESAEAYRSALAAALEEGRGTLRALRSSGNGRADRVAQELGALALGPLDPGRFATLLVREEGSEPARVGRFAEAVSVLERAAADSASAAEVAVTGHETVRDAVARALSERGRGFGAVRAMALLRTGGFREGEHDSLLEGLPFRAWRSLERELAPPVLVPVEGAGLDSVSGLAEFLDGKQKIVLLVREPCPPAPLARLLAPGTLVLQTDEPEALERVARFPGPAVGALVPTSAARFVHDPEGADAGGVLEVEHLPDHPPRGWIGGMSPARQKADLEILEVWGHRSPDREPRPDDARGSPGADGGPASEAGAGPASPPRSDPAERLAAWLLSQTDLADTGPE